MQEFIKKRDKEKQSVFFLCRRREGLAYHLEGLRVPLVVRVPRFGNHCLNKIVRACNVFRVKQQRSVV